MKARLSSPDNSFSKLAFPISNNSPNKVVSFSASVNNTTAQGTKEALLGKCGLGCRHLAILNVGTHCLGLKLVLAHVTVSVVFQNGATNRKKLK